MASNRIPDAVKKVFMETFIAADIAEPLASFDVQACAAQVRGFMESEDYDIVGVRRDGLVEGYVERDSLKDGVCGQFQKPIEEAKILDDTTPLLKVLMALDHAPFGLVTMLGKVGGIVTRADLQKPPVRMWLFGIVTLIESRFSELIERHCPSDDWKGHLSEARLEKAKVLLAERSRRNQTLRLIDCLQFADKGRIIARREDIRKLTIFASGRQAVDTTKQLEKLRNNLAHSQDILTSDWGAIVRLCEFIAAE